MAIPASKLSFHLAFFFLLLAVAAMVVESSFVKLNVVYPNKVSSQEAHGMDEMEEMTTDRRVLAGRDDYISYAALAKNNVPCNNRGHSYYNCAQTGQANPYTRGCTVATRCARR